MKDVEFGRRFSGVDVAYRHRSEHSSSYLYRSAAIRPTDNGKWWIHFVSWYVDEDGTSDAGEGAMTVDTIRKAWKEAYGYVRALHL